MSYATWMAFCVPLMLVNTVIAWLMILLIQRLTLGKEEEEEEGNQDRIKKVIANKKQMLGRMTQHEWQVVLLFIALILLWFFQSPKFMDGKTDCCSVHRMLGRIISLWKFRLFWDLYGDFGVVRQNKISAKRI